jgi:hypothetical protein
MIYGEADDGCDRCDIADEIEIEFVVECRVACVRWTDHEQDIAVSGRTHDGLGADVGAGARAIFNDELLTQPLRQPLPDEPRGNVRRAGWSDRHDQAHRPGWIGLCPSNSRKGRQHGSVRDQMQKISAGKFHLNLPSRHSITSSARASSVGGRLMASAFAVTELN